MTVPVHVALARIIADLPAIGKDDRMNGGGISYNYRGIEAITAHVQPLLAKHGVVIIPRSSVSSVALAPYSDAPAPSQAKALPQDMTLTIDWLIVGPDGSTLEARTVGVGRDTSDKTATKAATQAYKYLLLHLLCVSDRSDDADGIAPDYEEPAHDPVRDLFARVKAAKGTPYAVVLKQAAEENNMALTEKALADEPRWAEVVTAILDDAMIGQAKETANG